MTLKKVGKWCPECVVLRSKILTILLLGVLGAIWESFLLFGNHAKKMIEKKTSLWYLLGVPAECAEAVGGRGVRILSRILSTVQHASFPLLRTEDGAADSKRYAHSAGPA